MANLAKYPVAVLVLSFFVMWLSARIGLSFRKRQSNLEEDARQDLDLIVTGALTLLGLIIGFSFSMAISRYDQRKTYEEAEANAIGTEYVRADLLSAAGAERVRALLKEYVDHVFCSMEPATKASFSGSMLALPNCRVNCGLQ